MQQTYSTKILITGQEVLYDQVVIVEDDIIIQIKDAGTDNISADFSGHYLAPAFVDLQIYGAREKLFSMYPSPETLQGMYEHCIEGGTGNFLVTVATNTNEVFYKSIDAVREYWRQEGKGLIGLHLEGPWINPVKRGAHIEAHIKRPEVEEVRATLEYGKDVIKMVTLAPEVCNEDVISLIKSYGIVISAGHSNATFAEAIHSFSNGVSTVTHLFNAMSPLHHRDTGLPGAAFGNTSVMASIIADGHHVDFNAIKIAKKVMGKRLYLITDAVTETKAGPYQHTFHEGRYVCGNTLSGSSLTMLEAVGNCINHCGISAEEAFRMASLYPSQLMDIKCGTVEIGGRSSFLLLDEEFDLVAFNV